MDDFASEVGRIADAAELIAKYAEELPEITSALRGVVGRLDAVATLLNVTPADVARLGLAHVPTDLDGVERELRSVASAISGAKPHGRRPSRRRGKASKPAAVPQPAPNREEAARDL